MTDRRSRHASRDAAPAAIDPEAAHLEAELRAWIAAAPAGFVGVDATRAACYGLDPAAAAALERRFETLAHACFEFQFARVPIYRAYCDALGRTPGRMGTAAEIPALPVEAFERTRVATFPPQCERATFHTSGTTGEHPGILHLDGLDLYDLALERGFQHHVLPENQPMRMLVLAAPVAEAPHSSLTYMLQRVLAKWGAPGSRNLVRGGAIQWRELRGALAAAGAERLPVCLLGTALGWLQVFDTCEREAFRVALPAGSRLFETGGYKGRRRAIARSDFGAQVERCLGIPATYVVSEYGMTEMGSQFYTLGLRRALRGETAVDDVWSYPAWLRPRLLDSETGAATECDLHPDTGLLAHHDLANRSAVAHLLTADLGRGRGASFELRGRCPRAEPRGCGLVYEAAEVAP